MEASLRLDDLFLYGAHYGKYRRFSHPAMNQYVFGYKKGTSLKIIDLEKTLASLTHFVTGLKQLLVENKQLLFVATRPKVNQMLRLAIQKTGHHYISERWCGGTLTNWQTIQARILHLKQMMKQEDDPQFLQNATKRERGRFEKRKKSLLRQLEGILTMNRLPDALVLLTPADDQTALLEAQKLAIPVFAFTNLDLNPALFTKFVVLNNRSDRVVGFVFAYLCQILFPEHDWTVLAPFYALPDKPTPAVTNSPSSASQPVGSSGSKKETNTEEKSMETKSSSTSAVDLTALKRLRAATLASWTACKEALIKHQNDYEKAFNWLVKQRAIVVDKARTNNQGLVATFVANDRAFIFDLRCETDFVARNQLFQTAFHTAAAKLAELPTLTLPIATPVLTPIMQDLINKFQENITFSLPVVVTKSSAESFGFYNHTNFQQTAFVVYQAPASCSAAAGEKLAMHIVAMEPKYLQVKDVPAATLTTLKASIAKTVLAQFPDRDPAMHAKIIAGKLQKALEVDTFLAQKFIHEPHLTVEAWLATQQITIKQFYYAKTSERG